MIKALLPVPNRSALFSSIIRGTTTENMWGDPYNPLPLASYVGGVQTFGRDVFVTPLTYYKVFSQWNNKLVEHTFVTDEIIHPTNWNIHTECNGGVINTPPLLIPLSVKHHGSQTKTISLTYLFVPNIDNLLRAYDGTPLRTMDFTQPFSINRVTRLPVGNYAGVCSATTYMDEMFMRMGKIDMRTDIKYWTPPNIAYAVKDKLSPEAPSDILQLTKEAAYYEISPDALYDFVDDMTTPMSKDGCKNELRAMLTDYMYLDDFDPITLMCLETPTYLTLDRFQSLYDLSVFNQYSRYYNLACSEAKETEQSYYKDLREFVLSVENIDWGLEDIVEYFYQAMGTDITISLSKHIDPIITAHDRFGLTPYGQGPLPVVITSSIKNLFLNWRNANIEYDTVVVHKTWLGELFIECYSVSRGNECYYLDLNSYHLVTPSLVNTERLKGINLWYV